MVSIGYVLIRIVEIIGWLIILLVIINVFLSYFLSPFHPTRAVITRLVEPLLAPIRRYLPPMGMFDFSPIVLIILVQIISSLVIGLITMVMKL
jgi:YggT family protein